MATVKVRACCVVDEKGDWSVQGWKKANDDELRSVLYDCVNGAALKFCWLTAEVEMPTEADIAATVEKAD